MAREKVFFEMTMKGASETIKQLNTIEKELKKVALAKKDEKNQTEALKGKEVSLRAEKKRLSAQINKQVNDFNANKNAMKSNANSYDGLVTKNKALSAELRKIENPLGKNKKKFDQLSRAMNDNTNKLKKMDAAMGRNFRNVGNYGGALKKLGATFLKFAAGIGVAVMAINKLFSSMKASIDKFDEQVKAEVSLKVALGKTSKALLKQATALQQITRFGDEATIGGQAFLAQMGLEEDAILKLTPAILDMAQAKGMDLRNAFDLVAKSVGSSTNALSRYGIEITGAAASTERIDSAVKALNDKFRGQAEAATAGAGKIIQLDNAWGDLQEELGGIFVNTISPLLEGLHSMVRALDMLLDPTQKHSGALEKERNEMLFLVDSILLLNEGDEERLKLINKLKELHPDVVGNIEAEMVSNQLLADSIESVNQQLVNKIILAREDEKIEAKSEEKADAFEKTQKTKKVLLDLIRDAEHKHNIQIERKDALTNEILTLDERAIITQNRLSNETKNTTEERRKLNEAAIAHLNAADEEFAVETDIKFLMEDKRAIMKELGIVTEDLTEATEGGTKATKLSAKEETAAMKARKDSMKESLALAAEAEKANTEILKQRLKEEEEFWDILQTNRESNFEDENALFFSNQKTKQDQEFAIINDIEAQKIALAEQTQRAISDIVSNNIISRAEAEMRALKQQKEQGLISEQEFQDQSLAIQKRAFMKTQALKVTEIAMNLFTEISGIAANASSAPANAFTGGIFGLTQLATLKALAIARATINTAGILSQKFAKGGLVDGGVFQGNSHAQGGIKFASGGRIMEAQGGEAIINKRSTSLFKPILSAINSAGGGKRFALGGITPDAQLESGALSETGLGAEIARQLGNIKVTNVVSETAAGQMSINNIESEALF